jgi:hypothetical protein
MAVNPKERGLDILLYVNDMEARKWEAADSLGLDRGEFQKVMSMRHHHASKPPAEQVARIIKDNPFLEQRFEDLIIAHKRAFGQDGLANDFYRRLAPVAAQLYRGRELEFFERFRRANESRPWLVANLLDHLADGIDAQTRRPLIIQYVRVADRVIYQPLVLRLVREGGWDDEKTDTLMQYYKRIERASHGRSEVIRAVGAQGKAALPFLIRLWRLEPLTLFDANRERWDAGEEASRVAAFLVAFNESRGREIFPQSEIRSFHWAGKITNEEYEVRRAATQAIWPSVKERIDALIAETALPPA